MSDTKEVFLAGSASVKGAMELVRRAQGVPVPPTAGERPITPQNFTAQNGVRLYMTQERAMKADWMLLCGRINQLVATAFTSGCATKAQTQHEKEQALGVAMSTLVPLLGQVIGDIYEVGYVDGQGNRDPVALPNPVNQSEV